MPKPDWKGLLEQWFGHFYALGIVLGALIGPFAILLYIIREFTDWKLPWPFRGQWPPGDPWTVAGCVGNPFGGFSKVTQMDRVEDMAEDLTFTLLGYAIGQAIQIVALVVLLT